MARREFRPVYGFHYRGDTLPVSVEFPAIDGVPVDITGYVLFCTMKATLADADESALFSVAHTVPGDTEAAAGRAYFEVEASALADVAPGLYWLDVQAVIPGTPAKVQTLHVEQIEIRGDVTQRTAP